MEYFRKLQELLMMEKEEDRKLYQQQAESLSVAERRAYGLSWYPVAIRDTEMSRGDYLNVSVERTTHLDISHQLRFGASAALFSQHDPKDCRVEGIISYLGGYKLTITLKTDELPEWTRQGKLGIDLLFDDNSYSEMQQALKLAIARSGNKEEHLLQVLTGQRPPSFEPDLFRYEIPGLNPTQQEAVHRILAAKELAIVHGPPGTGKTTTLVQAVLALIKRDKQQVLAVAPSNTAVDLLSEKLSDQGLNLIRVGNPVRVSEKLVALTLDNQVASHPGMKEVKRLKKQAAAYRDMAHKYKRSFGKAERDQRKALFDEAYKILKEVEQAEQYIVNDLLSKADVITATLVGASHYTVRHLRYHTVVIDEAGQALEPACWIPLLKAKKLVLAGDHCQLPPTVKSVEAGRAGLSLTLLEKTVALYPEAVVLLEQQYRMNALIMQYPSRVFYGGRLKADVSVADRLILEGEHPLHFIDTAGCGFDEKNAGNSISNPEEASFLLNHLSQIITRLSESYTPEDFPSIALISPYKQQVELLKELLLQNKELTAYSEHISVNTIDGFQGQERDLVYISMTRSNTENKIGFLSDIRRMNVAMTRARKKLVVIGDSATLCQLKFYDEFIEYVREQGGYQSAWEYLEI